MFRVTTFITPFDREDIHDLASCMDDVIDGINSCAKRISIYNPRPISESGKELSRLIQEEAIYICKAMDELETFRKKPTLLREYCSKLHEIENHNTAWKGVRTLVDTIVAMEFAAS